MSRIATPVRDVRFGTPLGDAMTAFERAVVLAEGVDPVTTELVRLRCARLHDCRLCKSVRDAGAMAAGFDETMGAKVDQHETSDLEPRHKVALRLADAMILTPGAVDPALRQDLREHFGEAQIAELCLDVVKWSVQKPLVALRLEPPSREDELTRLERQADGSFRFGDPV